MRSRHQDDLLELVERIIADTEEAGEKTVSLNTKAARTILELAKLAPKPRGRQPVSGREHVRESLVLHQARSRKKKLIAEGKSNWDAHEQAAKEAAKKYGVRNVGYTTIMRRMEQRHRR